MPPAGGYRNVNALPILGGNNLVGGTGTYDPATGTISCGPWGDHRPGVGGYYNINGTSETDNQFYTFNKYQCMSANNTSDFRSDVDRTPRERSVP